MAGPADVEACRNELLQLKQEAQHVNVEYKTSAQKRIQQQQTMARLVQTVQDSGKHDTALVEDVIIASLHAETAASLSQAKLLKNIEPPPQIPSQQPTGRVSSAEEAVAIYHGQIAILTKDMQYRKAMRDAEVALNKIYDAGIRQIVDVVNEYCLEAGLKNQVQSIAARS